MLNIITHLIIDGRVISAVIKPDRLQEVPFFEKFAKFASLATIRIVAFFFEHP